jgi:glyoxylase-like metal-dependent hydrolase (beta-lactamase superfamily II)/rhodanese-related sulfurtransferase
MKFVQYYLDCLSQASYLLGDESTGQAAVVDPRRDVECYLQDAHAFGFSIDYVIETHLHADFLSGHLELSERTGAVILYGRAADVSFPHKTVRDGDRLRLGEVALEFRETPGHTPESISIVVFEKHDDAIPYGVLTGDALFIGDVGRPDLVQSKGKSAEEMASALYDSLRSRLLTLPDETRIFPAHGAGSACGRNLSTEKSSTIGEQRRTNYALRIAKRDEFVQALVEGQPPRPDYFSDVARLNAESHPLLIEAELPVLTIDQILERKASGAVVVDVRPPEVFARGYLAGSINVGLEGRFAEYAGAVIEPDRDVLIVGDEGAAAEARIRLSRVGIDSVVGVLVGPELAFSERPSAMTVASRLTADRLRKVRQSVPDLALVDVRSPGERSGGSIEGDVSVPLVQLRARLQTLDRDRPTVTYCASGYRSSIAASLLRWAGFTDVSDLIGGFQAWTAA